MLHSINTLQVAQVSHLYQHVVGPLYQHAVHLIYRDQAASNPIEASNDDQAECQHRQDRSCKVGREKGVVEHPVVEVYICIKHEQLPAQESVEIRLCSSSSSAGVFSAVVEGHAQVARV